jgi:hypothetical protein
MRNLERQVYDGINMREAMDAHSAMVIVEPGTISFPPPAQVAIPATKKLCAIIAAYRLMDVLCALQSPSPSTKNPRYVKLPHSGLLPMDKVSAVSGVEVCSPG